MNKEELRAMLESVSLGELSVDKALTKLQLQPYEDLGFAKIDTHRGIRQGAEEVIFAQGKTVEQLEKITVHMLESSKSVLITRLEAQKAEALSQKVELFYDTLSRIGIAGERPRQAGVGNIVIATGGTSDIPVAEEAALTAAYYGNKVTRLYDVGVAGVHRLLDNAQTIAEARVVIAAAGMEGALASVIAGMVDCPVIALPTSVGYGASFEGLAALLSMLNSCACGVSVVNIDNGFGAGYLAGMINKMQEKT
ncbi:MAG: nickel pincer cofactor biosynthesis protein LarB [Ruminococcaceae bacterium]|nr:nickel pincer cofactor biosynthesis protein LarB [Oscillospiraceae bacterium]